MLHLIFARVQQSRGLRDIRQVEKTTSEMMSQTLSQVQRQTDEMTSLAKDAKQKGELIGQYYRLIGEMKSAEIEANFQGVEALSAVQAKRLKYTQTKQKLLQAVRG